VGTIDIESEEPKAFSKEVQDLLESSAVVIRHLWPARTSS
jgi:putative methionine-R-sulfoxide reductase with GAF domain